MKKIHSIHFGGKILGAAFTFILIIPVSIEVIVCCSMNSVLIISKYLSIGFGILILFFLIVLLTIELHQEKKIILHYESQRNCRRKLGNNLFECQSCGNRIVKAEDRNCRICGISFQNKNGG